VEQDAKVYLVGGGIASMAAAAFLIRDAGLKGHNITILEESSQLGGSLDANGTPEGGYTMRGGRMLESKYLCTYDLFSSIPTLDETQTVTQEIFAWNETMKTHSRSRLVRGGKALDAPRFGLSEKHILTIEMLEVEKEHSLGRRKISDIFDASFFKTDFWFMWCTTFAFQPWHSAVEFKRYLVRFTHMVGGFNTLTGIMRTVFNQYDSLVRPLSKWLTDRGVQIIRNTSVMDLGIANDPDGFAVQNLICSTAGEAHSISVGDSDYVIATLGSMTESSSLGSMDSPPVFNQWQGSAWKFWETVARHHSDFGHPENFAGSVQNSKWLSFTTTLHSPLFFDFIRDLTGNAPGEGGLITFPDSNWLFSIVLPHQPHFIGQPKDVNVFWGYGLAVDQPGNFVNKAMSECSGREIMTEVMGHLRLAANRDTILESCNCIPCMMPFITSQFLPRAQGDRPQVVPPGSRNLAFVGQFCEMPDDVVFTVEYSIRSAQTAVCSLFHLKKTPPPVYKGIHSPRVLLRALLTLHGYAVDHRM
jgi:oleate hydratase